MRPSKANYYLSIALQVAQRGTCLRRNFGAVIVKDDQIISTGYTGAPRGERNCIDIGRCQREEKKIPSGERYELCRSVHAEMNAVIHASRSDMLGGTLYLSGFDYKTGSELIGFEPCLLCKRVIINAGLEYVVIRDNDCNIKTIKVSDFLETETI
jgi:dCMP deaminase